MIALEGSLQTRNYEDKTGARKTAYEVIVDQAYFADSKPNDNQKAGASVPVIDVEVTDAECPWID